jgi:hypothetical protein
MGDNRLSRGFTSVFRPLARLVLALFVIFGAVVVGVLVVKAL